MSWWNSSNFSDLASKALKNAQKQIDKALDIQDAKEKAVEQTKATGQTPSSKKDTTEKGDFWSSWLGDASGGTTESSQSTKNAWSLPWGPVPDQDAKAKSELVPEKTAEEIKEEVLKAAKERTKAKSKLFSQKSNKDAEIKVQQESVKPAEVIGEKLIDEKIQQGNELVQNKESSIIDDKRAPETPFTSKGKSEKKSFATEKNSGSFLQTESDILTEEKTVHFASSSPVENILLSDESDGANGSDFKEISENEADLDLGNETLGAEDGFSSTHDGNSGVNLEVVSDQETKPYESLHDFESQTEPMESTDDKISQSNTQDIVTVKSSESVDLNKSSLVSNPEGTDIFSSVEFVTEQDIESSEQVSAVTTDSCDNVGSDPELVDICDKPESQQLVEDSSLVAVNVEVSETTIKSVSSDSAKGTISVDIPLSDISLPGTAHDSKIADFSDDVSDNVLISEADQPDTDKLANIVSSDSESSMSKLDLSMDTCTSEETLVELNAPQDETDNLTVGMGNPELQEGLNVEIDNNDHLPESEKDLTASDLLKISCNDNQDEVKDESDSAASDDKGELSPANSFVKCTLEDAIDDIKQDDNSDSQSATEKSDGSRSVYSNHESSDEIDTTTSSDIEIISMPTPNGENRQVSPVDPIPLRIALQKSSWPSPTHRRTDSSDSSNTSKDGGYAELSPGRDTFEYSESSGKGHTEQGEGHKMGTELPALSEEDDPLHPQKLLKERDNMESHDMGSADQMSHDQDANLEQKLAEVTQILQAREEKLLQLSKENCDLTETNNILRNQLKQAEEAHETEMTDINALTTEFTERLTDAEKRMANVVKEKDLLRTQLQDAQAEIAKRAGDISLKEVLAEKEEQISGLLEEGEKLSKSQLQSNNIIKKLRQKEKDNDSTITTQKKKLDAQTEELDHLHTVLESKEELEKKQTEAITQLTAAVKKQEQELTKVKSDYEESAEKVRGLQTALDNSYKEMAELHRNNAAQDSKAQEKALSAEMQVREELKLQIEKQQQQYKWERETLGMQIEDLQMTMSRMEKDHSRREDLLRQEIADLQKQLQEDEARTQELTQGVSLATRPLLRQIENLQFNFNAQSATWEKVEKNLSDRLVEAQSQLAVVTEKERNANEQLIELGTKVSTLETQTSRLRQEKSQMIAQLEMLKSKVEISEDAKQHEAAQLEVVKHQLQQEITDVKKEKVLLETQLDMEKSKLEQEKKKSGMLQEQIKDLEREVQRSLSRGTPVRTTPSPVSVSRQDSMVGSLHDQSFQSITQEEIDRSFFLTSPNGNKQSLYEALRQSGAANLLENLQSQLKLREGEISHLQSEIRSLERTRESMAKELVDLSNKNDDLEDKVKDLPVLLSQHQELNQRYDALLQMYGEKVEEANELRLDLSDVKEMYKAQINQLLGQS